MISQIFALVSLLLRAFGLWEAFLDSIDKNELAKIEERRQAREKALDKASDAKTPDEAFDAQDDIIKSEP